MIQRIQSLFFLFSAVSLIIIVYNFPIIKDLDNDAHYFLDESFSLIRLIVLMSVALSLFAIFQYNNRKRQRLIAFIARFMITIVIVLIVFLYRGDQTIGIGSILLVVPFISLIIANYFINKDEKLINSANRIR